MKNTRKTEKALATGFIGAWLISLLIVLAFWGLVIWGIIELILFLQRH